MATYSVAPSIIRPHIVPPKASCSHLDLTKTHRIIIERLTDQIWREFLDRCRHSIRIYQNQSCRIVEVLGCIRYYKHLNTGYISGKYRTMPGRDPSAYTDATAFLLDQPLLLNDFVIEAFLKEWSNEFRALLHELQDYYLAKEDDDCLAYIEATRPYTLIQRSLQTAIRQSIYWKRLRHQVQSALQFDPHLLGIARRARVERHARNLSQVYYNRVVRYQDQYRQIDHDAPHLVWLLTLALDEKLFLARGELLKAIKKNFLDAGCQERGWRLIAKSQLRDLSPAIELNGRKWLYLVEYIKLHNVLGRNLLIPSRMGTLFGDPDWNIVSDENVVFYRGVHFPIAIMNSLIEAGLESPNLDQFHFEEVSPVVHWFAEARPVLDKNQIRKGWDWLVNKAKQWISEDQNRVSLSKQHWVCKLGLVKIGDYQFIPLSNAWEVRQEAIRGRHCADRYIEVCHLGKYRLYSVLGGNGQFKATAGYSIKNSGWQLDQIKGFANQEVSDKLREIAESISAGLDLVEEGAKSSEMNTDRGEFNPPPRLSCFTASLRAFFGNAVNQ